MQPRRKKILLVDDHHIFREGLALLLSGIHISDVILHAATLNEAVSVARQHSDLELAILDLSLPDNGAIHPVERLKAAKSDITIVVMSADESQASIEQSIFLGAAGYITKSALPEEMRDALETVARGQVALPHPILSAPVHGMQFGMSEDVGDKVTSSGGAEHLTPRQLETLSLLVRGDSNKAIARILGVSENTVKTHLVAIYGELQVTNRTQAVIETARREIRLPSVLPD